MDERLRALERAAAAGNAQARARWLAERVRQGELPAARLAIAAYAGDAGARLALGADAPAPVELADAWAASADEPPNRRRARAERHHARAWCQGLATWGREPLLRAAIAAARRVEGALAGEGPQPAQDAVAVADAWLSGEVNDVDSCVTAADAAALAAASAPGRGDPAAFAARAAAGAAYTAGSLSLEAAVDNLVLVLSLASAALDEPPPPEPTAPEQPPLEATTFRTPIAAAVREALTAWALSPPAAEG